MTLLWNSRVLWLAVCLHLLLACLPLFVTSKPTREAANDETDDKDENLRDRGDIHLSPNTEQQRQQQGEHPPQQGEHPPQQGEHPPQQGEHPPQQGEHPPQQGEHPPQQGEHPPQQGEHPKQQGSQEYGAGNVEEMVHGAGHHASHGDDAKVVDDVKIGSGTMDLEHVMHGSQDVHEPHDKKPEGHPEEQPQQQAGPGDVESLVHGQGDVHSHETSAEGDANEDFKHNIGTQDVEHMMHGSENAHAPETVEDKKDAILNKEFQSGNVESMVHGKDHVHTDKGQGQGPTRDHYSAGEDEVLKLGTFNVHDPAQRTQIATAGDIAALMGTGGGGEEEKKEDKGRPPTVVDTEHLMHGEGGHDHDVRKLKDLKLKEDGPRAKDRFSDLHGIVMHDGDHNHHSDDQIRRGKTITYKDIMDLGLDEKDLQGIDLKKLLLQNAQEYDDWQREKDSITGESPEGSFWEQIGELRKRYLPFGRNDGPATDLTGTKLDPSQQKWVSDVEGERGVRVKGEDSILHDMEILGSTAPKQARHRQDHLHSQDKYHTNGRDTTDL